MESLLWGNLNGELFLGEFFLVNVLKVRRNHWSLVIFHKNLWSWGKIAFLNRVTISKVSYDAQTTINSKIIYSHQSPYPNTLFSVDLYLDWVDFGIFLKILNWRKIRQNGVNLIGIKETWSIVNGESYFGNSHFENFLSSSWQKWTHQLRLIF